MILEGIYILLGIGSSSMPFVELMGLEVDFILGLVCYSE